MIREDDTVRNRSGFTRIAQIFIAVGLLFNTPSVDSQRSKSLQKALNELRAEGLELVYSPRLVRRALRVMSQPSGTAEERLEQLLAPHGLTALKTTSGAHLVIAAENQNESPITLDGTVVSSHTGSPLNGATVQVVERQLLEPSASPATPNRAGSAASTVRASDFATTGPVGTFRFSGLAPGHYVLEARRDDHLPQRASVLVQALPGTARNQSLIEPSVRIELLPRAFLNDEIAVRASETSLLNETEPSSLSLDREDVSAIPRLGNDIFRALSILPGITSNDVSAQPRIRGGRRDELKVVLDGQEIFGGYHLQDFDNGLSSLPADDLERVNVVAGNFSAATGDRMGGLLDLRTGTPDRPQGRLSISAINLEASYGGRLKGDVGTWLATARHGSVEYVNRLFGEENPGFWDVLGNLDLQLNDRHTLKFNSLMAGDHINFVEVVGSGEDQETDTLDTRYRNDQFWLTHQALIAGRALLSTSFSHGRLTRRRAGSESAEEQILDLLDRRQLEIDEVRQNWSLQLQPRHSLEFGASWRSYESAFSYQSGFERELTAVGSEVVPSTPPEDFSAVFEGEHTGAYVSDRLRLGKAFTVETGLRYDQYSRSLLPPTADAKVWSPRLSVAYQLSEKSILRAGWGTYYQSQRPYEISVEDGQTTPAQLERSTQAVLGFEKQFATPVLTAMRLEAYRRRISSPRIRFINAFEPFNVLRELEPDRVGIAPLRSRADGIEALFRGKLGERTRWWFNYSFSRSEDLLRSVEGQHRFVDRETDQPHAASLSVAFALPRDWQLSLALRYHTGWPVTPSSLRISPPDEDEETEDDEDSGFLLLTNLNSERLGDYHRLDLRLSRTWNLARGDLTFFIDVQNLYDRENPSGLDHGLDDGGLEVSAERWPGIFPSVGVRWKF